MWIRVVDKKGNMNKVNPKQTSKKVLVSTICSLFILSFFIPVGSIVDAQQPLDSWVAQPMYISPFAGSTTPQGYNLTQIQTAYNLPSSGGAGTTIAIIDAYDTPNILNDYTTFCNQFGLPNNSTGNFIVHKMPGVFRTDSGWAMETCLDVEWAHAIAPEAKILLVEATSPSDNALLAAIDYATSQPGVVAVSMSWGGEEFWWEANYEFHFNKPGITFFASSGDDGSKVMWPAVSANVVSVGGTTLNLNPDGTVISETAWRNSSGGVSNYVAMPIFQTNFGLDFPNRAVPDVSYNGDASTGVAVCYNNLWYKVGGTSAGAPQWAAIQALGLSVTGNNLYGRAKSTYSSYFRDITSGSNYVNSTTSGYDLVTGLGSPLTVNFGTEVTVSPTYGPPGGLITLNGVGFTPGSSVNISYQNSFNSPWVPLINNLAISSNDFSYPFSAPDLLQNNAAGDNPSQFDTITFKVMDNSSGRSYNTTIPYVEWRRGIAQIGNLTARGLYGNNTNLALTLFVQNGDSLPFSGKWFSPGNISLFWDGAVNLGTVLTDESGFFNTTLQVPTTTPGQHTLVIKDNSSDFCVNLTRLPTIGNNFTGTWQTSEVRLTLTPDYGVNETFYRINGGATFNVSSDGQPTITIEGSNNTLEYWSTWSLDGTSTLELPHVILTGIKLDKTAPTGSITPSEVIVDIPNITLSLNASDGVSGVAQMRFANDNSNWSSWEPYGGSKEWTLQSGDGIKSIFVQFMDNAGLISTYNCTITLETSTTSMSPLTSTASTTPIPTQTPTQAPTPSSLNTSTPTPEPSVTPQVPELNMQIILVLLIVSTLLLALISKRKRK